MAYSSRKAATAVLAASIVAHAIVITPNSIRYPAGKISDFGSGLLDSYERYRIRRDREELVADARRRLRSGTLNLGEFLLKGNDLDAREKGEKPDLEKAMGRYNGFLRALLKANSEGKMPYNSVPEIFKGVAYYGIGGGTVLEALEKNGGSCAQYAPLIASLLYDAFYWDETFMRSYGTNENGVAHITPIYRHGGKEYDLMAGNYSEGKGTLIPATEIIEAYARAHGLAPPLPPEPVASGSGSEGKKDALLPEGKPMGLDFPSGKDSYPGAVPLFAENAISPFRPPAKTKSGSAKASEAEGIGSKGKSAEEGKGGKKGAGGDGTGRIEPDLWRKVYDYLNPVNLSRLPGSTNPALIRVHPVDIPTERELSALSMVIEYQRKKVKELANEVSFRKVYAMGELAGLYEEAEWEFKLAGRYELGEAAAKQRDRIIEDAASLLEKLDSSGSWPAYTERFSMDVSIMPLVYLGQKGQDVFFSRQRPRYVNALIDYNFTFALAREQTRERALEAVSKWKISEQAQLFPTLKGAQLEGLEDFFRAYRIFNFVTDVFASEKPIIGPPTITELRIGEKVLIKPGYPDIRIGLESVENGEATVAIYIGSGNAPTMKDNIGNGKTKRFGSEDLFSGFMGGSPQMSVKVLGIKDENGDTKVRLEFRLGSPESAEEPSKGVIGGEIIRGTVRRGESIPYNGYNYRYLGVPPGKDKGYMDVSGPGIGKDVPFLMLGENETAPWVMQSAGMEKRIFLKMNGKPSESEANISILSGESPPARLDATFTGLLSIVESECAKENLGEEWKTVLVKECAGWLQNNKNLDKKFSMDYAEWLTPMGAGWSKSREEFDEKTGTWQTWWVERTKRKK